MSCTVCWHIVSAIKVFFIQISNSQTQWNLFFFFISKRSYYLSHIYGLGFKSLNCSQPVICHMLCVMWHVPLVRCQVSYVTFHIFFLLFSDTLVKLVNGGSVISGLSLSSLYSSHGHSRPHWELTDKKEVYVFNKLCLFFLGGGGVKRWRACYQWGEKWDLLVQ